MSFIKKGLTEEQYEVSVALDGKTGFELFKSNKFDLIILDIMLPEMNGLEVCKAIRKIDEGIPVLFLTALGTSENIVLGLESGADDYLVKPFKFIELMARIKTLLRRTKISEHDKEVDIQEEHIFRMANLEINDYTKTVSRSGTVISLTSTEYRLLLYFIKHKYKVLNRMDILEQVWDINFDLGTNVVDVYVNYLRKKIDSDFEPKLIHTVVGMGYVLKDN